MDRLQCLFCGWHMIRDTSKVTATPWDPDQVQLDLMRHLDDVHFEAWYQFLELARSFQHAQMVAGNFPRIVDVTPDDTGYEPGQG